jgi:hypothetical protein
MEDGCDLETSITSSLSLTSFAGLCSENEQSKHNGLTAESPQRFASRLNFHAKARPCSEALGPHALHNDASVLVQG